MRSSVCVCDSSVIMANMRIKIRCNGASASRDSVLRVLCRNGVECSKLQRINSESLLLFCNSGSDIDKIFQDKCFLELQQSDCEPIFPADLKARRSIIIKSIDPFIYNHKEDGIKLELQKQNVWATVAEVFKFPNSKTVKVTFTEQSMVDKALDGGLLMFNLSITSCDIARERFIDIPICYRCYKWNDHKASECSKDPSYVICSICSSTDHNYKTCKSPIKKCINCCGNHATVSYSCQVRKTIARSLGSNKHHSPRILATHLGTDVAASVKSGTPVQSACSMDVITSRSIMCVMVAALKQPKSSAEFESTINSLLTANNLPSFRLGMVSPPILDPTSLPTVQGSLDPNADQKFPSSIKKDVNSVISIPISPTVKSPVSDKHNKKIEPTNKSPRAGKPSHTTKADTPNDCNSPVAAAVQKFSSILIQSDDLNNTNKRTLRYNRKNIK